MTSIWELDTAQLRLRHRFASLVRPLGGVMEDVVSLPQRYGDPRFEVATTSLSCITMAFPHLLTLSGLPIRSATLGGAGGDADGELAWVRAVVEGAERYCTCVHMPTDFVVGSADELGAAALDLASVPPLSEVEYADPSCPLSRPDPTSTIRWVRGHSLVDDCERLVPAIMTHLYLRPWAGETFWLPISTGVAAHPDLATALVAAICEVIERDALALTWLTRRQLPRIDFDGELPPGLARNLELLRRSMVRQLFFDATTDLGIPTVYTLQLRDGDPYCGQLVNAATDFDPAAACEKSIRESAAARGVFQRPQAVPERVEDFSSLEAGARYLAPSERRGEFAFLLDSPRLRPLAALRIDAPADSAGRLRYLVDRLRAAGMDAIAVDLTTDEVREAGLWVVRAVIPGLLPMSTVWRARFLGHPRLAGHTEINPAPQPFA